MNTIQISESASMNGMDSKELKRFLQLLGSQIKEKEIENIKLKISKEYELKMKDLEKVHYER